MSTHGDGDPPDEARAFCDFLFGRRAPRLPSLEFAVLALGDTSYPRFCEIGRRVDERLAELGAKRLYDRIDCDVDFEASAATWSARAVELLQQARPASVARAGRNPATGRLGADLEPRQAIRGRAPRPATHHDWRGRAGRSARRAVARRFWPAL